MSGSQLASVNEPGHIGSPKQNGAQSNGANRPEQPARPVADGAPCGKGGSSVVTPKDVPPGSEASAPHAAPAGGQEASAASGDAAAQAGGALDSAGRGDTAGSSQPVGAVAGHGASGAPDAQDGGSGGRNVGGKGQGQGHARPAAGSEEVRGGGGPSDAAAAGGGAGAAAAAAAAQGGAAAARRGGVGARQSPLGGGSPGRVFKNKEERELNDMYEAALSGGHVKLTQRTPSEEEAVVGSPLPRAPEAKSEPQDIRALILKGAQAAGPFMADEEWVEPEPLAPELLMQRQFEVENMLRWKLEDDAAIDRTDATVAALLDFMRDLKRLSRSMSIGNVGLVFQELLAMRGGGESEESLVTGVIDLGGEDQAGVRAMLEQVATLRGLLRLKVQDGADLNAAEKSLREAKAFFSALKLRAADKQALPRARPPPPLVLSGHAASLTPD